MCFTVFDDVSSQVNRRTFILSSYDRTGLTRQNCLTQKVSHWMFCLLDCSDVGMFRCWANPSCSQPPVSARSTAEEINDCVCPAAQSNIDLLAQSNCSLFLSVVSSQGHSLEEDERALVWLQFAYTRACEDVWRHELKNLLSNVF